MTIEELRELLQESGADAWSVTDEKRRGWQFYYIRHKLDQNRVVNTEHITVTVYEKSPDGKELGSASQEIPPTFSGEEAAKTIQELLKRASFARNPVYELRKPYAADIVGANHAREGFQETGGPDLPAIAGDFIRTMTNLPETETEDVNSCEIFTDLITKRLLTSTGIDVTEQYPSSMLEVVTNAREAAFVDALSDSRDPVKGHRTPAAAPRGREIELYRMYRSGTCDSEGLKKSISRVLLYGKDRLHTVPTPEVGTVPVILSTADAVAVYDYFVGKMNAQQIYQKTSDWKIGEPVVRDPLGDVVTIRTRKELPNSSMNFVVDEEGAPIRDELLIERGIARNYWGNMMYSSWLGLQNTFLVTNYEVSGGSLSEEEIRRGRYLEIVEFSDFQVDVMTGNIFGEIRLGYLHDKDGITIVSGGSVSGSMRDYAKEMYCSKERVQYDHAVIPAVTKLMNVTVTGSAK